VYLRFEPYEIVRGTRARSDELAVDFFYAVLGLDALDPIKLLISLGRH